MKPRPAALSLSGCESIANILCMEFMPGPLPLPLGKKGKDEGGNRKGIYLRRKWG